MILGLFNMFNRKGAKSHVLIGRIYVIAMFWICVSALSLITFYRFSFFLLVIAVITFYTTFVGLRVLRRKKLGSHQWYDWFASIVTGLFGFGLVLYAISIFLSGKSLALGILSLLFGGFTLGGAVQDVIFFIRPKTDDKLWWLYQHIGAIGGSYIAAVTAFAVQNGEMLGVIRHNWLLWVLPGVIGSQVIAIAIRRQKKKRATSAT